MHVRPLAPFFLCAYCNAVVSGEPEFAIHRDGFGEGPEVPLCHGCGSSSKPSCTEIWNRIAKRAARPSSSLN